MEVGSFSRWLKYLPVVVAVIGLVVLYDIRAYHGFSSPEAMDAAQVARNLAEGRGYTTDFIRPFSVYLVQKHNRATHPAEIQMTNAPGFAQLDGTHPDLANAPVYPTLLAGLMKLGSPDWKWRRANHSGRLMENFCAIARNLKSPFSTKSCCWWWWC